MEINVSSKQYPTAKALIDAEDWHKVSPYRWRAYTSKQNKNNPYCQNRSSGKTVYLHRFIVGAKYGQVVDHINKNSLDCRKSNLRICTPAENSANRRKANGPTKYGKTSKYYGVSFCRTRQKYVSAFRYRSVRYSRYFSNEVDAALQFNEWANKHHGDYANLNEVVS